MIKYVPIAPNKGLTTIGINIDMKINFIPLALLEYICKKFCKDFFRSIMEISKEFVNSKWEEKVK
jgi:hypothetical protein